MKELEKEIQESIAKNLPSQVGEVLKERLELIPKLERQIESLLTTQKDSSKTVSDLESKLSEYKSLDTRNSTLVARESAVDLKDRNLEIESLKVQLAAEKDKSEFAKNTALGLVRNIEYRSSIHDSQTQASYSNGNNYVCPSPVNTIHTESKSAN